MGLGRAKVALWVGSRCGWPRTSAASRCIARVRCSCVDRKAVELGLAGARTDYIQTDAAINKVCQYHQHD